jgi:Ribosomal protein L7/L12 dimerisation domain
MADLQKIADDLSKLTVLEAAELSKALNDKWSTKSSSGRVLLFDDRKRTRMEPLKRGDSLFQFYDECGRSGYDEFRSIVNGWLAEMPGAERGDLITRIRNGGDREFGTALCELQIHAFLIRSGYKVVVHPQIPGSTKHPDFAVTDQDGKVLAYVEVTTVNPPAAQDAEVNRENPVYKAIDAAKVPAGSCLGYRLIRAGKNSPAIKRLVAEIEQWARDNVETAKKEEVSKRFTAGEWVIELDLYAGGDESDPAPGAIGVADLRGGIITAHKDVRKALDEKSKRYGTLDAPYLIVVADAKDQLFTKESIESALTDAVLGDEIVQFQGGKAWTTRAKNGFWHGKNGPRNRHVSGVLLLPRTDLWKLREDKWQPILAVNPWAERELPVELKTLKRFEAEENQILSHRFIATVTTSSASCSVAVRRSSATRTCVS